MRIVVSGGRNITDVKTVERGLDGHFGCKDIVITGGCRGVDQIAHYYASRFFVKTEVHTAAWEKYGKAAGPIRNREMIKDADILIAFWDGESRGTKDAIDLANEYGVETHIYYIKEGR